jgi:serine/threonine protein phosphatase PrpC
MSSTLSMRSMPSIMRLSTNTRTQPHPFCREEYFACSQLLYFLLCFCSDGLFDVMSDQHVVSVVMGIMSDAEGVLDDATAMRAAEALVHGALDRNTQDNVTAIVMLFEW